MVTILFTSHYSLFTFHFSLFTIHFSLFTIYLYAGVVELIFGKLIQVGGLHSQINHRFLTPCNRHTAQTGKTVLGHAVLTHFGSFLIIDIIRTNQFQMALDTWNSCTIADKTCSLNRQRATCSGLRVCTIVVYGIGLGACSRRKGHILMGFVPVVFALNVTFA